MRESYNGCIKLSKKNNLQFVSLGADFCAEHEWGIQDIRISLGVSESGYGLDRRRISKHDKVRWHEGKKYVGLYLDMYATSDKSSFEDLHVSREMMRETCKGLFAGWSQRAFYVMTKSNDAKSIDLLKELYNAFVNDDICIWLGGKSNPFENSGLCFGVISRMPDEIFTNWTESDKDYEAKQTWFHSTGIENLLRRAGKNWYFLGNPTDISGKRKLWLNPYEQHIHNAGWFTIEELKLWAEDKGPVMKRNK